MLWLLNWLSLGKWGGGPCCWNWNWRLRPVPPMALLCHSCSVLAFGLLLLLLLSSWIINLTRLLFGAGPSASLLDTDSPFLGITKEEVEEETVVRSRGGDSSLVLCGRWGLLSRLAAFVTPLSRVAPPLSFAIIMFVSMAKSLFFICRAASAACFALSTFSVLLLSLLSSSPSSPSSSSVGGGVWK